MSENNTVAEIDAITTRYKTWTDAQLQYINTVADYKLKDADYQLKLAKVSGMRIRIASAERALKRIRNEILQFRQQERMIRKKIEQIENKFRDLQRAKQGSNLHPGLIEHVWNAWRFLFARFGNFSISDEEFSLIRAYQEDHSLPVFGSKQYQELIAVFSRFTSQTKIDELRKDMEYLQANQKQKEEVELKYLVEAFQSQIGDK